MGTGPITFAQTNPPALSCKPTHLYLSNTPGVQTQLTCTVHIHPIDTVILEVTSPARSISLRWSEEVLPPYDGRNDSGIYTTVLFVKLKNKMSSPSLDVDIQLYASSDGVQKGPLLASQTVTIAFYTQQAMMMEGKKLFAKGGLPVNNDVAPLSVSIDDGGNGNQVFEPGESVTLVTRWLNFRSSSVTRSGTVSQFTGNVSTTYTIQNSGVQYGSIASGSQKSCQSGGCSVLSVTQPAQRVLHWDASIVETLDGGETTTWTLHIGQSFQDVTADQSESYRAIETALHLGMTSGCGNDNFCPGNTVTRGQLAYMLGKARLNIGEVFPPAGYIPHIPQPNDFHCWTGGNSLFSDIDPTNPICRYVHGLYLQDVMDGCDEDSFCRTQTVSRAQFAKALARSVAYGKDNVPSQATINGRSYNCSDNQPNHFTDVNDSHPECAYIHYLWAKGVFKDSDAEFQNNAFQPSANATRAFVVKFIVRGHGLELYPSIKETEYQGAWEWGLYDLIADPTLTIQDIKQVIDQMTSKRFNGIRLFMNFNAIESTAPNAIYPYPKGSSGKYNICQMNNTTFWERYRQAIQYMKLKGYQKILVTMGHTYNSGSCRPGTLSCPKPYLPWHYNEQGWTSADGNWMNRWDALVNDPSPCSYAQNAQDWIKIQYKELSRRLYQYTGEILVVELFNEVTHNATNHDQIKQAHIDLTNVIHEVSPDITIQFNIDPELDTNSNKCPKGDDSNLQSYWNDIGQYADVWAMHTFVPWCFDSTSPNRIPDGSFFWTIFNSGKLEVSIDGQFCHDQGFPNTSLEGMDNRELCNCCHILTGETLDQALKRAVEEGYHMKFAPFDFEHSWGGMYEAQHDDPYNHGYYWDRWESDEVACLASRLDTGNTSGCGNMAVPNASTLRGRTTGNYHTGTFPVESDTTIRLLWNSTFETSGHSYSCSVTTDLQNENIPQGNQGAYTLSSQLTCANAPAHVTLSCTGMPDRTLTLTLCGNNTCDMNCETPSSCSSDCWFCNYDSRCQNTQSQDVNYETQTGCIDCARPNILVNGQEGSGDEFIVEVQPDQTYTVSWQNKAPQTAGCTVYRQLDSNPRTTWVSNAWSTTSKNDIITITASDGLCTDNSDCTDPCFYCDTTVTPNAIMVKKKYTLECSEHGVMKSDFVTAQATAYFYKCKYDKTCN